MFRRIASAQIGTQMNLQYIVIKFLIKDVAFVGQLTINQIELNNYF